MGAFKMTRAREKGKDKVCTFLLLSVHEISTTLDFCTKLFVDVVCIC